jgi:hypothetical protein
MPEYFAKTPPQGFTARKYNYLADSVIKAMDPAAKLYSITSDTTFFGGISPSWHYRYGYIKEGANFTFYFLHTTFNTVVYDSSNNITWVGVVPVSLPWIDSDSAWALAEAQGGSAFRLAHPNVKINADLGQGLVPNSKPGWTLWYRSLDNGDYAYYGINAIDSSQISGIKSFEKMDPNNFVLYQNYPNPFNPSTVIRYKLSVNSFVSLTVFDALGNQVASLANEVKPAGSYEVNFNSSKLSSGVYYYRLKAGNYIDTKKFVLIK